MRTITNSEDIALQNGFEYISDTAAHNSPVNRFFVAIQVVTAATFTALTADVRSPISGNTVTGVSIPAGTTIYGKFTAAQLSAGSVIAYKSGL